MTEAQKKANKKWDSQNMTVLGCKVTKDKAKAFRDACAALGVIPNQILKEVIDRTIAEATNKNTGA